MSAAKNSAHLLVLRLIAARRRDAQAKRDAALQRKAYGDASAWDHEDIGLMMAERIVIECMQNAEHQARCKASPECFCSAGGDA